MRVAQLLAVMLLLGLLGYICAEYALPALYKGATQTPDNTQVYATAPPSSKNTEDPTEVRGTLSTSVDALPVDTSNNLLTGVELPENAEWVNYANQYDKTRLQDYLLAINTGNADAYQAEQAANDALMALLSAEHQPIDPDALLGQWRCRTTKVGGIGNDITTYTYFACQFLQQGAQLFFEKTSGSQRTSGLVYANTSHSMVYLGASTVNNDPQQPYSGPDNLLGKDVDNIDTPALLVQLADDHLLMLFPYPARESVYDILELRR